MLDTCRCRADKFANEAVYWKFPPECDMFMYTERVNFFNQEKSFISLYSYFSKKKYTFYLTYISNNNRLLMYTVETKIIIAALTLYSHQNIKKSFSANP